MENNNNEIDLKTLEKDIRKKVDEGIYKVNFDHIKFCEKKNPHEILIRYDCRVTTGPYRNYEFRKYEVITRACNVCHRVQYPARDRNPLPKMFLFENTEKIDGTVVYICEDCLKRSHKHE